MQNSLQSPRSACACIEWVGNRVGIGTAEADIQSMSQRPVAQCPQRTTMLQALRAPP